MSHRFMTTPRRFLLVARMTFRQSVSDIARVCVTSTDQQPGRDAKVLSGNQPGMWEQDQTDLPNESLTGMYPPPVPMSSARAF